MMKITKKKFIVALSLFVALILAFFPSTSFIRNPFVVDAQLKQQHYNETGLFTISPYEAGQYYSFSGSNCFWIDIRDAQSFSKSHLKPALNESLTQLKNLSWNPGDLILVYGNNTADAQQAVALLRQVVNARAFAVKGGFSAVNRYLIEPIDISITNQFNDKELGSLMEARSKISGDSASTAGSINKFKSTKSKAIREGC